MQFEIKIDYLPMLCYFASTMIQMTPMFAHSASHADYRGRKYLVGSQSSWEFPENKDVIVNRRISSTSIFYIGCYFRKFNHFHSLNSCLPTGPSRNPCRGTNILMSNLQAFHVDRTKLWEKLESDSLSRFFVPTYSVRSCLNQQYPSALPRDPSVHRVPSVWTCNL